MSETRAIAAGLILAIVVILGLAVWFHLRINRARGPRL